MEGKSEDLLNGGNKKIDIRFHGMCGDGLWMIDFVPVKEDHISVSYSLIGLLTDYKKSKYFFFTANRMNNLLKGIYSNEKFI